MSNNSPRKELSSKANETAPSATPAHPTSLSTAAQLILQPNPPYHLPMPVIATVTDDFAILAAQSLFREYGQWLRATQSCGTNYPILDAEIASLPAPYTTRNGEVLLALIDDQPAACIAYRAVPGTPTECEIKRLYVRPAFQGRGLARALVAEALTRAGNRHFTRAILDTDTSTMPAAHALYLSLGFREYAPRQGSLAYLDLRLEVVLSS